MGNKKVEELETFYRVVEGRNRLEVGVSRDGETLIASDFYEDVMSDLNTEKQYGLMDQEAIEDWYSIANRLAELAKDIRESVLAYERAYSNTGARVHV